MKINFGTFALVVIPSIGVTLLMGCKICSTSNTGVEQSIKGTNLKLVARYDPARIYVYVDTSSTNATPDYLISQGNPAIPVVFRETTSSNTVETTHFENGYSVLETKRNESGRILKRYVNYEDDSGRQIYSYVDRNGDGLFDLLIKSGTNGEHSIVLPFSAP